MGDGRETGQRRMACITATTVLAVFIGGVGYAAKSPATLTRNGNKVVVSLGGRPKIRVQLNPAYALRLGANESCYAERTTDTAYLAANTLFVVRGISSCSGLDPEKTEIERYSLSGRKTKISDAKRKELLFSGSIWRNSPDGDWSIDAGSMDGKTEFDILRQDGSITQYEVSPAFDSWGEHEPDMGFGRDGSFVMRSPPWSREHKALVVMKNGKYTISSPAPPIVSLGLVPEFQSETPQPPPLTQDDLAVISKELEMVVAELRLPTPPLGTVRLQVLDRNLASDPKYGWKNPANPKESRRESVPDSTLAWYALRNLDRQDLRAAALPPGVEWIDYDSWSTPTLRNESQRRSDEIPLAFVSLPAYPDVTKAVGKISVSIGSRIDEYYFGLAHMSQGWSVEWMEHEEIFVTVQRKIDDVPWVPACAGTTERPGL